MKITPEKFQKLKKWTFLCLAAYIIFLALLYKYTLKVNPGAFTYIPMIEANPWEDTLKWSNRLITFGFIGIGALLIRDVKQHKDHPLRKFVRFIRSTEEENDKEKNI